MRPQKKLPPLLTRYLCAMKPTLKPNTLKHYKYCLAPFHRFVRKRGTSIAKLERRHVVDWLNHTVQTGLHPTSRRKYIICLRRYFRWLHEQGNLPSDPDRLLKISDMPKKPEYLPRPLPPNADRQLQDRLEQASCIYQQGLLLMRHTGLRIGELMSLEQNCIRNDYNGNRFLKVPLGKLDNERLVPLTDAALALIEKLQNHGAGQKTWLLESQRGKKTQYDRYVKAMHKACEGLEIDGKMTTHRMRHSYATSLLCGGMSLVGLMKLLGHRDHRMTLRYAAITQETVRTEFFEALLRNEKKYNSHPQQGHDPKSQADPLKALSDVKRWISKRSAGPLASTKHAALALNKRIDRIQISMTALFPDLALHQK